MKLKFISAGGTNSIQLESDSKESTVITRHSINHLTRAEKIKLLESIADTLLQLSISEKLQLTEIVDKLK